MLPGPLGEAHLIRLIAIRNFRSIAAADIDGEWITTFVGSNDAGKSNVLRALNLFFNGRTGFNEPFDFSGDYNQFAPARQKKTPQIEIRIRFELPRGYLREEFPDQIEWKKVWREDGEVRSLETRSYVGGERFPARSKIPALLDRIRFTYVPAIKDQAFFDDLQGQLYDVLASVAAQPLEQSAQAFQNQLGVQLRALLEAIKQAFSADATMRLPANLREIFESLEINSGGVPLSRRGDGIKIRHIPMILGFIADKRDELLDRGGVRYTHIWGFEEPENNVEMSAAFQMAKELVARVGDAEHFQLFITTHSPIFYRLDQQSDCAEWVKTHFVEKVGHETQIVSKAPNEVDATMGLMPLVAPFVAQAKQRYEQLQTELANIRKFEAAPTVMVEGHSDKRVLQKAWKLFSGKPADAINISDGEGDYGGAHAVHSRALAWLLIMRHKAAKDRVRGAAVFDADPPGAAAKQALHDDMTRLNMTNSPHFKVIALRTPGRLQALLRRGFRLPIDLEAFYSDALWEAAKDEGWLQEKPDLSVVLNQRMMQDLAAGRGNPFDGLNDADKLRVKCCFTDEGKGRAAARLSTMAEAAARLQLAAFEPLMQGLAQHLTP